MDGERRAEHAANPYTMTMSMDQRDLVVVPERTGCSPSRLSDREPRSTRRGLACTPPPRATHATRWDHAVNRRRLRNGRATECVI